LELATFDSEIERTARDNLRIPPNSLAGSQSFESDSENLPFIPTTTSIPSCIVLLATNAIHFNLKPCIINTFPSFNGLDNEDPYVHVRTFLDICDLIKVQNFSEESVRLRLFPLTLHDRARSWLLNNRPGSITSWEMLQGKFYHKFFPIYKINDLCQHITNFRQKEGEKFSDSWEKFKELTTKCPPHDFENETIVQYFYMGLTHQKQHMLESMNGGEFLNLMGDKAYKTLDDLTEHAQQWDFQNSWDRQLPTPKMRGLYKVKNDANIRELKELRCQFDAMALSKPMNAAYTYQVDICGLCASLMHFTQNYPTLSTVTKHPTEQVNAFNDYKKPTNGPRLTIQGGGITPISLGGRISHLIREGLPLKLRISISHHTKLNSLLIKYHSLHHSLHWMTHLGHSCSQLTKTCNR
jgi:hypothetical protein